MDFKHLIAAPATLSSIAADALVVVIGTEQRDAALDLLAEELRLAHRALTRCRLIWQTSTPCRPAWQAFQA
jgi:predicted NBD/HSP70 family sugar kinase